MHGAKPKAKDVLGLGVWGKGVPRLGGLNTPVFLIFNKERLTAHRSLTGIDRSAAP